MAIIGILVALLLPALAGAKERARRANCQSNVRQFALAVHLYADENQQRVMSGAPNPPIRPNDDHLPVLSDATSNAIVRYSGTGRMAHCPSFGDFFTRQQPLRNAEEKAYGYIIGYNYHGGHTNTPWPAYTGYSATWVSPQKLTDDPGLVLVSDMNDWSPGYGQSYAPHGKGGPVLIGGSDFANPGAHGASSPEIGARGGNVGLLDGSVAWREIKRMQVYRGSQLWEQAGCWAMW